MKKIALCKEYKITFTHEVLYLITFFLFAFVRILDTSLLNIDFLSNVVFIIVCATLAVLWITYDKVSVKKLLCQIIIISAFLLVTITTTRKYLLIYALFLLASNCAEFKKIVKYSLIATLSATCIVMIASQIGIVHVPPYRLRLRCAAAQPCSRPFRAPRRGRGTACGHRSPWSSARAG